MKTFGIYFTIVFLVVVYLSGCGSSPSTPEDFASEFFRKVEAADMSVTDMMAPELVQMLGQEKIEKSINQQSAEFKEKGGIASIEVVDKEEKENEVKMKVKLTFGNGTTKTDDMSLIKKDGNWYVTASK